MYIISNNHFILSLTSGFLFWYLLCTSYIILLKATYFRLSQYNLKHYFIRRTNLRTFYKGLRFLYSKLCKLTWHLYNSFEQRNLSHIKSIFTQVRYYFSVLLFIYSVWDADLFLARYFKSNVNGGECIICVGECFSYI